MTTSRIRDRPGLAAGTGDEVGTVLYSRGIYAAMLAVEAAKKAQEIHGVAEITPAMMRDGMANLVITEELMEELGLPNFGPAFEVTCQNHGGTGEAMIQQWDAKRPVEPDHRLDRPTAS
jgi:branched-chain amino acid transport system substrate-binding protein